MERYTVRYWWVGGHGQVGCIVADEQGTAYLFWHGILQLRCTGPAARTSPPTPPSRAKT